MLVAFPHEGRRPPAAPISSLIGAKHVGLGERVAEPSSSSSPYAAAAFS